MDFYILYENFIEFLSYIDSTGIIPMWNDICLVDICTTETLYLWKQNIPGSYDKKRE